jgi:AraC-like DNA-binding protein
MAAEMTEIPAFDRLPSEVYFRYDAFGPDTRTLPHAHDWGQLNYVTHGIMHLEVAGQRFISPPQYAVWIPRGFEHSSYNAAATTYRSAYVSAALSEHLPAQPCTLAMSPILRAILSDFAARDVKVPSNAADLRLAAVLMDQLRVARVHDAYLPYASSDALRAILQALQAAPGDDRSLAEWAQQVNMTPRTLERTCQRELGMALGEWRQRLRFTCAIDALDAGRTVQHIAYNLGYSTPSAFIAMFRRMAGTTPEQYRRQRHSAADRSG